MEAYGLIAFFASAQILVQIFDAGFSSSAIRIVTRFRSNLDNDGPLRLKGLEIVFGALTFCFLVIGTLLSEWIAKEWVGESSLSESVVRFSILAIVIATSLKWFTALYRAILIGNEAIKLVAVFNMMFATGRFVCVVPLLYFVQADLFVFFAVQIVVTTIELAALRLASYRKLAPLRNPVRVIKSISSLSAILHFASASWLVSVFWIVQRQYDKTVLVNWLSLENYGYYSLAVVAGSVVLFFNSGFYNVIMPRFSMLIAQGSIVELKVAFKEATHLILLLVAPLTAFLCVFSEDVMTLWLGEGVPKFVLQSLILISLGNLCVVLIALPYAVQFGTGNLKPSVLIGLFGAMVLPFSIQLLFSSFGVIGAAINWAMIMLAQFVATSCVVFYSTLQVSLFSWLFRDVLSLLITPFVVLAGISFLFDFTQEDRLYAFVQLSAAGLVAFLMTALASREAREIIVSNLKR